MKNISIIGAGRLGQVLAVALSKVGRHVEYVSSKHGDSAQRLAGNLPNCRAVPAEEAVQADLVFLCVPDDAIVPVADRLPWRGGQAVVHCSGATEVAALDTAAQRGALTGGFHPLQIFSAPQVALRHLTGSTVAIEAPSELAVTLNDIAKALGMKAIHLPEGSRPLYHASAGYAASMMLPLLHEAVQLWQQRLGVDENQALQALLPLARGTLDAVQAQGLAGALSGPVSRGDSGVLKRHVQALEAMGAAHVALYKELTRRQLPLASQSGRVSATQYENCLAALADSQNKI